MTGLAWFDRLSKSPIARRLALGALWSIGGTVASRAISLVASIATARILGKDGFGEFGIVVNTMGLFLAAASLGLGLTAMKYVAVFRHQDPARAARIASLTVMVSAVAGLVAALALAGSASWMATRVLGAPGLEGALRASALGLLFSSVSGAQAGALAGFGAFRAIAASSVLGAVIGLPFIVAGAARFGVEGAVWGTSISLAVGCAVAGVAQRRIAGVLAAGQTGSPTHADWSLFWRFSLPAFLSSGATPLVSWITAAMLVNRPQGYAEMGLWNAANQWFTSLLFLPTALAQVVLPALAERLSLGDRSRAGRLLLAATGVNAALALVPAAAGIAASAVIMGLYGESFREGWGALAVSLGAAALFALQAPSAQLVEAAGHMWARLAITLFWSAVVVGMTVLFLDNGASGLAWARAVGYAASGVCLGVAAAHIARSAG